MSSETYVPTIRKLRILKAVKRIRTRLGKKDYVQRTITIPKDFGEKLEKDGVKEIVAIADDFFIAIPPTILTKKSKGEIIKEFGDLLDWLKEHARGDEE